MPTKPAKSNQNPKSAVGESAPAVEPAGLGWTFLTNHALVLLCLYRHPNDRLREVAVSVGITERMVQRIVVELSNAGYLQIIKEGRCNRYVVNSDLQFRHPLKLKHTIGELLSILSQ